jgi:acyl carrier protein
MLRNGALVRESTCPVCGRAAATLTFDRCCGECNDVLQWFQNRLDLVGYRPTDRISLASSFAGDLAVDSLDLVEIICDLEHDFDVVISGNDAIHIGTVGDAVACVRHVAMPAPPVDIVSASPRRGLQVAPARLRVGLSQIFARIRRPR